MPTTLFDAKPYDPAKDRQKRNRILLICGVVILIAALFWWFRFLPYEHRVDQFFTALEQQNYEQAYGIWMHDADWKQHPQKYARYTYGSFYLDWGPGGEWGLIKSHKVIGTIVPKGSTTGVVVGIIVNQRAEQCHIWMDRRDKTMSFSPY